MNDIAIQVDSLKSDKLSREFTPTSVDDDQRKELPWEEREEKLLRTWIADIVKRSSLRDMKGQRNKIKYAVFGVPTILIPIILGGMSRVIPNHSMGYSLAVMLSGVLSGVSMFFNFGKKQQEHFDYSNKFFELANEVDSELSKPKRFRVACDVYIERIKQTYNSLVKQSPTI
jgi:hypothetical protein